MKNKILIALVLILIFFLSGCYKDRDELFTIALREDTFIMDEDIEVFFLGKEITSFEVTFSVPDESIDTKDGYPLNVFGDFSTTTETLFSIELYIGIDSVIEKCNVKFDGAANPQRSNAYKTLITIPNISDEQDEFFVVFDFEVYQENLHELEYISIQIKDTENTTEIQEDAYFTINNTTNN